MGRAALRRQGECKRSQCHSGGAAGLGFPGPWGFCTKATLGARGSTWVHARGWGRMGQGHSHLRHPPARCPTASHPSALPCSHLLASHYVERHVGTGKNSSHSTVSTTPRCAKQHHRAHSSMPGCEHRSPARCSPRFMDDGHGWLLVEPLCPAPGVWALPRQMTQGHAYHGQYCNGLPACPWHGSAHCCAHSLALGPCWCLFGCWARKAANPRGHQQWV